VVSGHAGATELITNNENGVVLQNIFDAESMGHELSPLLKDPRFRDRLGAQARETALKRRWDLVAEEYLDFYSQLFTSS
jgi:glycosyltransferase involved in cell wall biosynthesis